MPGEKVILTPGCMLREWEILCGVIGMWKEWQQWIEKALSLNLLEQRCKTSSKMQGTHFSERRWGWLVLRSWQASRKMVNPIPVGSTNHPQTSAGGKEKVMTLFLTKPCPYLWTWWHFFFFPQRTHVVLQPYFAHESSSTKQSSSNISGFPCFGHIVSLHILRLPVLNSAMWSFLASELWRGGTCVPSRPGI